MAERRKLIEVALPLEAISAACRREKDKKTGTIRNVHKWFAPMPVPAWRALLVAALVDDPGTDVERQALLDVIEGLVPADGGVPSETALIAARQVLEESFDGRAPSVFDPFCGGGSTLVEAQRLGLSAIGSDLNPVPVLITRVLTRVLPSVAGQGPIAPDSTHLFDAISGPFEGFVSDVMHYAERVRDRVWDQVGDLYPAPRAGRVVAWLWARTFVCSNPACRAETALASSFWLTKHKDSPVWLEPVVSPDRRIRFEVRRTGAGPMPGSVDRTGARCLVCQTINPLTHVREEGRAGRLGVQLMTIAVDGADGRYYVEAADRDVQAAEIGRPDDASDLALPDQALGFRVQLYGMTKFADLFTDRQLTMLGTFADAVAAISSEIVKDGGDDEYARAVASVLGLGIGKLARANSTQATWNVRSSGSSKAEPAFSRQALPMVWDFAEVNPFGESVGSWIGQIEATCKGFRALPANARPSRTYPADARTASSLVSEPALIATDPPYFGQIGYADLSDFFYMWLRRALREVHPDLFATIATPKGDELIADPHRHGGGTGRAADFFVRGFTDTFRRLADISHPDLPLLVVYAHRQEESGNGDLSATAWDAMLSAIINAGLGIVGTWPVHATRAARQRSQASNALASYIILVCRPRPTTAAVGTRREFLGLLRSELRDDIRALQQSNIPPVDLAQASIGPGMAIFSRYAKVVEADGSPMPVRTALALINQALDEILSAQEGDLDADTRFAVTWFEQQGSAEGPYGDADVLARAKNTSVGGLVDAGVLASRAGKVRLLSREELPDHWDPLTDRRLTAWEATQHLTRQLEVHGEAGAADLLRRLGGDFGEQAKELAYRLYVICERNGWAQEALGYNALVVAWPEIARQVAGTPEAEAQQQLEV